MKTPIASSFTPVGILVLATLIISIHGCDHGAPRAEVSRAAANAPATPEPSVRYQSDPARNRVWALTAEGASVHEIGAPESIDIPLPGWQWVDAPYGSLPDLALGPDGEALITSNVVPTLWRIDPITLAVTVHPLALDADTNKDLGFSALVYSPEHAAYFAVSEVHGSLWRIDRVLGNARKLRLSRPLPQWYGLSMRVRSRQEAGKHASLCVSAPEGSRTIDIAPDESHAYVRDLPCADPDR